MSGGNFSSYAIYYIIIETDRAMRWLSPSSGLKVNPQNKSHGTSLY